jgi:hypothetical protein
MKQLADCRSPVNGRISLLNFAVRIFTDEYQEVVELPTRMEFLKAAAKFDIAPVISELNTEIAPPIFQLEKQLALAEKEEDTIFVTKFGRFCKEAKLSLQSTKELGAKLTADFNSFIAYFGESEKITFKEMLVFMDGFFVQFGKAITDNVNIQAQEKKKQQLEERVSNNSENECGLLDSALGNLRAGATLNVHSKREES